MQLPAIKDNKNAVILAMPEIFSLPNYQFFSEHSTSYVANYIFRI
jgi:hypothetical protein